MHKKIKTKLIKINKTLFKPDKVTLANYSSNSKDIMNK
jgi:uncharacterized protein YfkK (UPF0435 family)